MSTNHQKDLNRNPLRAKAVECKNCHRPGRKSTHEAHIKLGLDLSRHSLEITCGVCEEIVVAYVHPSFWEGWKSNKESALTLIRMYSLFIALGYFAWITSFALLLFEETVLAVLLNLLSIPLIFIFTGRRQTGLVRLSFAYGRKYFVDPNVDNIEPSLNRHIAGRYIAGDIEHWNLKTF